MSGEGYIETAELTPLLSTSTRSSIWNHSCFDNIFDKIWLTCLALVLIVGLTIGIYLISIENDDELSNTLTIISRNYWHAHYPKNNVSESILPYHKVLILQTNTEGCERRAQCVQRLKRIQQNHMREGYTDILYNFVIAGDGKVYEGKGWSNGTYLTVAILGNFTSNPPSSIQKEVLIKFLNYAVSLNKLVPCYEIVTEHYPRRYFVDLATDVETFWKSKRLC